jgi:2-phospho-L-lactate guanylyltransferase
MQATVADFDPVLRSGRLLLDDGTSVTYGAAAFDSSGLRLLRSGQRLTVHLGADGIVESMGLPGLEVPTRPE